MVISGEWEPEPFEQVLVHWGFNDVHAVVPDVSGPPARRSVRIAVSTDDVQATDLTGDNVITVTVPLMAVEQLAASTG